MSGVVAVATTPLLRHYSPMFQTQLIHFTPFSTADVAEFKAQLPEGERQRAERFVRESDQRAYIIAHFELRRLLAISLGCSLDEVNIITDEHGKPHLADQSQLFFNLSHAGDYALVVLSDEGEVGVDIERHDGKPDFLAIAKRFFTSDEYLYIEAQADQLLAFYTLWTYKEAYVKAIGRGIAYGMNNFSVVSADLQLLSEVDQWSINPVSAPSGYSAAVALCVK